jgi:hypothetical protein
MIRCVKFTPLERGSLRGFCDLALNSGIVIHDALLMESNGRRWVNLPGKPCLDRDKKLVLGEDGKIVYSPVLSIDDRGRRDAFNMQAVVAIDAFRQGGGGA